MRLLGLDVGSKTVGVAISDPLGITAQELETIKIDESKYSFGMRQLRKIVRKYDVEGFVLGLPKNMDGSSGHSVQRSKQYGESLIFLFTTWMSVLQRFRLTEFWFKKPVFMIVLKEKKLLIKWLLF